MRKFLTDLFTENDGNSFCLARVSAFLALIVYLIVAGGLFIMNRPLDMGTFGSGLALVLGAGGGMLGLKQFTARHDN